LLASFFTILCSLLSFFSATICQKIKADGGLELLINTVKDPNTPVKQLEKMIYVLSQMFDMGISMVAAPESYAHEDVTSAERSTQGDTATGNSVISHTFVNQEMARFITALWLHS